MMKAVRAWTNKMFPLIMRCAFYGLLPARSDPKGQRHLLGTHYLLVELAEFPPRSGQVIAGRIQVREQSEPDDMISSEMREVFKQHEKDVASGAGKPVAGTALIIVRCGEVVNPRPCPLFQADVNRTAKEDRNPIWESEFIRIVNLKSTKFYTTPIAGSDQKVVSAIGSDGKEIKF